MLNIKKRIVIIGATSGIAEQCARLWIHQYPADLILVGRDKTKVEIVAADLRVRNQQSVVRSLTVDFTSPAEIKELVDGIVKQGAVDIVLIAHGSLPDQQQCQEDLTICHEALTVNGVSPVVFAEAFAGYMQLTNSGTLAIMGSVAGDRGRKSNYVYGAAKGLVSRYAQGLQHRLANTGVKVVLIKPGPTDTPMTAHLRQQGISLASAQDVAKNIVQGISQGRPVIYAPIKWALIMMIIRHLPAFIFNKLDI